MAKRTLVKQVSDAFDAIFKPGTSRHQAKAEGTDHTTLFSYQSLRTYKSRTIAAVKWIKQERHSGHLLELRQITHDDWIAYVRHCEERGLAGGSIRATIAAIHKLEHALRERGWWRGDTPYAPQITTSIPRSTPRFGFSLTHARAIIHHLTGEVQMAARLALSSGLRINEIARLRTEDIDFTAGTIHVQRTNAKGGRERLVTSLLDPNVLRDIPQDRNYVFSNPNGLARQANREIATARDTTGVSRGTGLSMHAFRAAYAEQFLRQALDKGLNEDTARQALTLQLGHSRPSVTYRYCPRLTPRTRQ